MRRQNGPIALLFGGIAELGIRELGARAA